MVYLKRKVAGVMSSKVIPLRLSETELARLDSMVDTGNGVGAGNRGEFLRLLIHREFCRRKGLPQPCVRDWQSQFRTKKPKTHNEIKT